MQGWSRSSNTIFVCFIGNAYNANYYLVIFAILFWRDNMFPKTDVSLQIPCEGKGITEQTLPCWWAVHSPCLLQLYWSGLWEWAEHSFLSYPAPDTIDGHVSNREALIFVPGITFCRGTEQCYFFWNNAVTAHYALRLVLASEQRDLTVSEILLKISLLSWLTAMLLEGKSAWRDELLFVCFMIHSSDYANWNNLLQCLLYTTRKHRGPQSSSSSVIFKWLGTIWINLHIIRLQSVPHHTERDFS